MAIFSSSDIAIDVPLPALGRNLLTEPAYINKHFATVRSLMEGMRYREEDPKFQEKGARLASTLMDGFPGVGSAPADVSDEDAELLHIVVQQDLAYAATKGFALASLYGQTDQTTKAMYETLVLVSHMTLPEVMRPLAAAHVFACEAGHYIGHHGEEVTDNVASQMDWSKAWGASVPVVPVAEEHSRFWAALCGAKPGSLPDSAWGDLPAAQSLRLPDSEETRVGTEQRQRATGLFWGGAAVFVAAALSAIAATDGGLIWTGGLLVGALLIWKSAGAYQRSTALGIPGLHVGGWATVALAAVVCLAVGGTAGVRYLEAEEVASQVNDVGSCWKVDGEMVELTGCSGDVDFVATDEVRDPEQCPMSTESYVDGRRGHYLCLGAPAP